MAGASTLRVVQAPRFVLDAVCVSCTAPEDDPSTFASSDHWKLVLHPDQTVPGSVLVVSRRHVPKLGALTEGEASEFFGVAAMLERAMESSLGATMVNFSCLRNWAFRSGAPEPPLLDGRPNPHVHWHVAPRYASPMVFAGEEFVDRCFGEELAWERRRVSSSVQDELIERLTIGLGLVRTSRAPEADEMLVVSGQQMPDEVDRLLRDVPEWFGIPESNDAYVEAARSLPTWAALVDGDVVGVCVVRRHNAVSAEIELLVVGRAHHRAGVGRRLVEAVERDLVASGVRMLQVKTFGPSGESEEYERTRAFYRAVGFIALEENMDIWGKDNPCLISVKPIG